MQSVAVPVTTHAEGESSSGCIHQAPSLREREVNKVNGVKRNRSDRRGNGKKWQLQYSWRDIDLDRHLELGIWHLAMALGCRADSNHRITIASQSSSCPATERDRASRRMPWTYPGICFGNREQILVR